MVLPSYFYRPMEEIRETLKVIGDIIEDEREDNKRLKEQIKELKDEHYKDEQLTAMRTELETAKADLYRGFGISKEENKDIENWIENHENTVHGGNHYHGLSGGGYEYIFYPTGIGTSGKIRCCNCGEKYEFQKIGW